MFILSRENLQHLSKLREQGVDADKYLNHALDFFRTLEKVVETNPKIANISELTNQTAVNDGDRCER